MPGKKRIVCVAAGVLTLIIGSYSCNNESKQMVRSPVDYIKPIPGPSNPVPVATAKKGAVLIAYSDCYSCHKEDKRSVGPAFKDIAKRYPVNDAYIQYLSKKIISGGSGSWGAAVMTPHPGLSPEHAEVMVSYILSMRK